MKLKFAMIGGAGGFIGNVHRTGATMDNLAEMAAGCFSRDAKKNSEYGELWSVSPQRTYTDYNELIEKESKIQGEDRLDFIIIATPNITHFPIAKKALENDFHVVCDKPVTIDTKDAIELNSLAKKHNKLFGVTYTYANYAMVREAHSLIENGDIGSVINIVAEYPQDWVIVDKQSPDFFEKAWRFDKKQAGNSAATADIGTHIIAVIEAMTGLKLKRVLASFDHIPADMPLETNTQVLLRYENNVPGILWASQVAIGHECSVRVRIFGDKGAIDWSHDIPYQLKVTKLDGPVQYYTAGRSFLSSEARDMSRLPAGHPEGLFSAFGNIYRDFCTHLLEVKQGLKETKHYYQTIEDGIDGLKFVDSCIESNEKGNIWVDIK